MTAAWYLMRGSGVMALILLTSVVVLGIATSKRAQLGRLPRFVTVGLHRSISLLAVVFLAIHVGTAIVDPYASVRLLQIVMPLPVGPYPVWLGLGALSLDVLAAVIVTSLLRQHLSQRVWKSVHWLAYASWRSHSRTASQSEPTRAPPGSLGVTLTCAVTIVAATAWRLAGSGQAVPKHLGSQLRAIDERAA